MREVSELTPEERAALRYYEEYEPPEPVRHEPRFPLLRKLLAPVAALIGLAVKFGALTFKFFGIFISVGAYALFWGWKFAVGLVLLILVHELGHFVEAKRQGLNVSLPRFIPFIGAYVVIRDSRLNPFNNALVALAGPAVGALGAAACWGIAEATGSDLMFALAYTGFLLNLINLAPIGILDGGAVWNAIRAAPKVPAWNEQLASTAPESLIEGGGRTKAIEIAFLYVTLAGLLVLGMIATHVPRGSL
jgi:Zn-dependent protease